MKFKAQKYRIYPNKIQQEYFAKEFGCNRFIYNYCLDLQIKKYAIDKTKYSKFDLNLQITKIKKDPQFTWLNEVNSQSLCDQTEHLECAFTKFFKKQGGFPKFKSKKDNHKSFKVRQSAKLINNKLKIPKVKEGIKIVLHKQIEGTIQNVVISKTPTNKYYASITYKVEEIPVIKKPICENQAVGIDLGIKTFAVISDNSIIENPKHLRKSLKKIKILSKRHSKKIKGSKNREKLRLKLALQYEKVTNQRKDFLHKTTSMLLDKYDTICLETLNVSGMVKNHKLALSISDLGIGMFNQFLEYKTLERGNNILRIGIFQPSTKICNICGAINNDLKLSDREWTCTNGHELERDFNAALNIKKYSFIKYNTAGSAEI